MQIRGLTPNLSVAPQIEAEDLRALATQGFRSVVNNRPDGESPDQPDNAELESAARAAGLEYRYLPVTPGRFDEELVARFGQALEELPGPTLAFCRTGTRSTTLWALASAPQVGVDAVLDRARSAGYDLAPLRPRLQAARG